MSPAVDGLRATGSVSASRTSAIKRYLGARADPYMMMGGTLGATMAEGPEIDARTAIPQQSASGNHRTIPSIAHRY